MLVLNTLFPVFALIGLGTLLKHIHLTGEHFLKASDRWSTSSFFRSCSSGKSVRRHRRQHGHRSGRAAICAVAIVYLISAVCLKLFKVPTFCRRLLFPELLPLQHLCGHGRHHERPG
jgi:hypothetical protein